MKQSASAVRVLVVLLSLTPLGLSSPAASNPAADLIGVWEAKRNFGPEVRGTLTITQSAGSWRAEIAGFAVSATMEANLISFEIPGARGEFRGRLKSDGGQIIGHWIQPARVSGFRGARRASPVALKSYGKDRWRGEVIPLEDELTLYLVASGRDDGSVGVFLRNPERNLGVFLNVDRLERTGDTMKLIGRRATSHADLMERRNIGQEEILAEGIYRTSGDQLTIYFPSLGASFDFKRVVNDEVNGFYARGRNPGAYHYTPPPSEDDGWATGTLGEAGISLEPIRKLIETIIYPPPKSVHDPYIHGLLIARHGKLVLEEYFHGFHRQKPHDTRSASKSLTSTLLGAAIQHGLPLSASSRVYKTVYGDDLPPDLDARKRKMTLEHLMTMSSGLDCDDRDLSSRGAEEVIIKQTEYPDRHRYELALPTVREPGEKAVYCSASADLVGGVLSAATRQELPELFHALIAEPLQVGRYYMVLTPAGHAYMGGGIYWLPRDFIKLGQVMLDGGIWDGHRIVSKEWASRATAPLVALRGLRYGYHWWSVEYPYRDGTVRAFFASGNGGQVVMGIPKLDLLVAFFAGNYSDPVLSKIRAEFIPQYILPAVAGDMKAGE